MFGGLQTQVDSMFPALRDLTPDADTLKEGENKLKFGRLIDISGYHTEVFDMHSPGGRKSYAKRMLDLSKRAQIGTVRILVHDRQIMQRKDGSSGWFGYIEWMEYTRVDPEKSKSKEK